MSVSQSRSRVADGLVENVTALLLLKNHCVADKPKRSMLAPWLANFALYLVPPVVRKLTLRSVELRTFRKAEDPLSVPATIIL